MNDTSNPNGREQSGRCVLESLRSAVNEGAQQARAAAEKAIPKVKAAVSGATYWLGFGSSFAAVFSYTLVKELAPEVLKAGCRDGARAGKRTAGEWASKAQPHATTAAPSDGAEPSAPTVQPGMA